MDGATAALDAVPKTLFLDIVTSLNGNGFTTAQIPAKIEGIAFGEDVTHERPLMHTLWIANDNDFLPGISGPNQFFVFGFTDSDLPGFMPQ